MTRLDWAKPLRTTAGRPARLLSSDGITSKRRVQIDGSTTLLYAEDGTNRGASGQPNGFDLVNGAA